MLAGAVPADRPVRGDEVARHLVRADDAEAAPLEELDRRRQHVAVAADDDRKDLRQALDGAEIELELLEIGPRADAADQHHVAAAMAFEQLLQLADLAPAQPDMREALDALVGFAVYADDQNRPALRDRRLGDMDRHRPAAGNDRERFTRRGRHRPSYERDRAACKGAGRRPS